MQPIIPRGERICIDISDNVVSVIKLDPEGMMMRAGSAKAPSLPQTPDDAYVTDLSKAIRNAAWAAKVSTSFGTSCILVSGKPEIVIQRFTWPDMPTDALQSIVQEEMIPYIPGDPSHFTIGCEVLRREENVAGSAMLEIIAAAAPMDYTAALTTACRWANFKPKRMELRENARGRFAHYWCAPIEGEVPTTFAILDVGPGLANIGFYHHGLYHSSRYFTPELVKLEEVQDFDLLMTVKAGGIADNEKAMRYEPDTLTNEISSAINHFNRSVQGSGISCVLLMDDENIPGMEESLRAQLDTLILKPSQWVTPGLKRPNLRRVDQTQFLDAFAAGVPPLTSYESRMDLRLPEALTSPAKSGYSLASFIKKQDTAPAAPASAPLPITPLPIPEPAESIAHVTHQPITPISDDITPLRDDFDIPPLHTTGFSKEDDYTTPLQPDSGYPAASDYDEIQAEPHKALDSFDFDIPALEHSLPAEPESDYDPILSDIIKSPPPVAETPLPIMPLEQPTKHHDAPFETISAKSQMPEGFPYAIPEEPRPTGGSIKPIIIAAAVVLVVLLIAILIPLQETMYLRGQLDYLQNNLSGHVPAETIIQLQTERTNADRQISAVRHDRERLSERKVLIRDFYLQPPALVVVPEILHESGLRDIETIMGVSGQVIATGTIRAHFPTLAIGVRYLRYHPLFEVSIDTPPNDYGDGSVSYEITINMQPSGAPFWLHDNIERRWP